MTTAEYIGKVDDINSDYDLVYIGLDAGGYNVKTGAQAFSMMVRVHGETQSLISMTILLTERYISTSEIRWCRPVMMAVAVTVL